LVAARSLIVDRSLLSFRRHFNLQLSIENSEKEKLNDHYLLSLRPPSNLHFDVEPKAFIFPPKLSFCQLYI
jgi:hypothetical protein